jgi:cell division protein FtsB
MTNEELLQKVLSGTVERLGKQASSYEAEIANLSSQIIILSAQIEELTKTSEKDITE